VDQTVLSCGGKLNIPVRGIAYDSRRVKEGFLFLAIEGFKNDGHHFIEQAIANGATALVVQKPVAVPAGMAWIRVPDTRQALALLSTRFYDFPSRKLKLIGVTGTNGKTTTTHLLAAVYRAAGEKVGLIGTIANRIGDSILPVEHTTPESLELQQLLAEMASLAVETVVMEVSSHALALKRVAGCRFNTGVFTNVSQDHLDFHQNMDDYLRTKAILFEMLGQEDEENAGFAVVNGDDPGADRIIAASRGKIITYGLNEKAKVKAASVEVSARGVSFHVRTPWGESRVMLKLTGLFNVYNALAALAAGGVDGLPLGSMVDALEAVPGVRGRFESIDRGQDFTVIVDYAHTPDGLENVLKTAGQLTAGKLITVFGCGGDRDRSKRPLMGEIAARYSDIPVVTSDNPRTEDPLKIIAGIEEGLRRVREPATYMVIPDRRQAIARALRLADPGDVVVIAGKGHENYQLTGTQKFPFDDREEAIKVLENHDCCRSGQCRGGKDFTG
jgi:UDP-N-acetylmuramoyl-L-alanyl-D-glutamate--2,6-diaminopimelate ligase